MQFKIINTDKSSKARAGIITSKKNIKIETPIFMPVGTFGTVRGIHQKEILDEINTNLILSNTYHLNFRPGLNILKHAKGIHNFINWNGLILTDSGGYQVYSLASNRKITEKGVTFKSHIDGSSHIFTPENVVQKQRIIGSDFMMAFDECTPPDCSYMYSKKSMDLTHRWLQRGYDEYLKTTNQKNEYQVLIPIVQGSTFKELRQISAETISNYDLPANAIGGVCHTGGQLYDITNFVCNILPKSKPRYLMGVGTPEDLLECIALGVDMFDCVIPTRNGRNGKLYTTQGTINIKNKKWKNDFSPIDETLGTYVSTYYNKSYLNHLFSINELLGCQIASIQNLTFYLWLVKQCRKQILENNFLNWKNKMKYLFTKKL